MYKRCQTSTIIDVNKIVLLVLFLLWHLFRGISCQLDCEPLEGRAGLCPSSLSPSPQHNTESQKCLLTEPERQPWGTTGCPGAVSPSSLCSTTFPMTQVPWQHYCSHNALALPVPQPSFSPSPTA